MTPNIDMTPDLDNLKQQWKALNTQRAALVEANRQLAQRLARGKVTTLQQRLARETVAYSWVGLALVAIAPLLHPMLSLPWWLCVIYAAFGILMTGISRHLGGYIKNVQLIDLPVWEAVSRVAIIRRRQWHARYIGICGGMIVLGLICWQFYLQGHAEMLWGCVSGVVIGATIGLPKAIRQTRMARRLQQELEKDRCD